MQDSLRALGPVIATFALLMAVLWFGMDALVDRRDNPNRDVAAGVDGPQRVELEAGPGGHYRVPGRINGQRVSFMVDTGASHVAVPGGVADELGLQRGAEIRVVTANGRTTAYNTRLDSIAVGGIQLRDVRGSINPSMGGDDILLGMTFLREVEFRQVGGRLILEQRSGS
jgi:aspartyl protease family protein